VHDVIINISPTNAMGITLSYSVIASRAAIVKRNEK